MARPCFFGVLVYPSKKQTIAPAEDQQNGGTSTCYPARKRLPRVIPQVTTPPFTGILLESPNVSVRWAVDRIGIPRVFGAISSYRGSPSHKSSYVVSLRHSTPHDSPTLIYSGCFSPLYGGALATERRRCKVHCVVDFTVPKLKSSKCEPSRAESERMLNVPSPAPQFLHLSIHIPGHSAFSLSNFSSDLLVSPFARLLLSTRTCLA